MPKSNIVIEAREIPSLLWDFQQVEHDLETVIRILQPGSVGIVEHKFTDEAISEANATVKRAVENWRMRAKSEARGSILQDYIDL